MLRRIDEIEEIVEAEAVFAEERVALARGESAITVESSRLAMTWPNALPLFGAVGAPERPNSLSW